MTAPDVKVGKTTETKVTAAALGSLLASVVTALLNGLVGDSELLGGLPPWLQFVLITVVPPVVAFLAGYAKKSQTSVVSDGFVVR